MLLAPLQSGIGGLSLPVVIAIAVGVFVLLIGGVWLIRRRSTSSDDSADSNSGTDRISEEEERQDNSLPLRTKASGLTLEAKLALVGVVIIVAYLGFEAYSFFKTGSPSQVTRAAEFKLAVACLVIGLLAIRWYHNYRRKRFGRLEIEYEHEVGDGGSETSTVWFDPRDVVERPKPSADTRGPEDRAEQTETIVHETTRPMLFGLFRRAKRVVEDPELRNGDLYRPYTDKIGHRIPRHASYQGDNVWHIRTKGRRTTQSAKDAADIEYQPPHTMSKERRSRMETNMDMLQREARELATNLAHAESKNRTLQQKVDQDHEEQLETILKRIERISGIIAPRQTTTNYNPQQPRPGRSRDGAGESSGDGSPDLRDALMGDGGVDGGDGQ